MIIGAGPAGLSAAIQLKTQKPDIDICVIEKGAEPGNHNLSGAVLEAERRLVWSVLTVKDLNDSGIGLDDTDPLIDALRTAQESDVAVLLKDLGGGRIKGSMRSRGRIDVGAIAEPLGGGGHHNAAGFTVSGSVDSVMDAIRRRLEPVDA